MYGIYKGLLEDSKIVQRHRYILLIIIIWLSTWFSLVWFKLDFNIHFGAVLTLDACMFSSVQYLSFSLGILTWLTQLIKSNMFPNAVTTKVKNDYIFSKHAQDQYSSFSFEILAPYFMINDYYYFIIGQIIFFITDCNYYGSTRAPHFSRGYE